MNDNIMYRAPENETRGTRWVWTKHIWLDKRIFQLKAGWTQLTADCIKSHQIGQTVLKIGQNLAQ